jgi:hypothetical protein
VVSCLWASGRAAERTASIIRPLETLGDDLYLRPAARRRAAEHSRRILDGLTAQRGAQPPARNVAYTEAQEDTDEEE